MMPANTNFPRLHPIVNTLYPPPTASCIKTWVSKSQCWPSVSRDSGSGRGAMMGSPVGGAAARRRYGRSREIAWCTSPTRAPPKPTSVFLNNTSSNSQQMSLHSTDTRTPWERGRRLLQSLAKSLKQAEPCLYESSTTSPRLIKQLIHYYKKVLLIAVNWSKRQSANMKGVLSYFTRPLPL